ncbi:MAG: methyltransferase domain-containing protein, partial [Patescibacteria group bacterium]|nr:methyltransferase domain-containing protein [Patescibacteria group bacterium]
MTDFALTRSLHTSDIEVLKMEVSRVWASKALQGQHPMRQWEYALALYAVGQWWPLGIPADIRLLDVGGGGSHFHKLIGAYVLDPVDPTATFQMTLGTYVRTVRTPADVVCCLSVLEHVDDLQGFLEDLAEIVAPGGLLVLTMDACDDYV